MQEVRKRQFDVPLSKAYAATLGTYALVFRHLIERIGVDETTAIWEQIPSHPDALTQEILNLELGIETEPLPMGEINHYVRKLFAKPIRGIGTEQVTAFLRSKPPFSFIDQAFPVIEGALALTIYQFLHLSRDALARIAEDAIVRFGKAGELMIYDALLCDPDTSTAMTADEFMKQRLDSYQNPSQGAGSFTAGLNVELVSGDECEIVAHVTQCEWARYFLEHHPTVGYLLACSTDDPVYRQQCKDVRFQRRCTLMEGGDYCEFDFYRL